MAGRIKGITVEIGGDVTGLEKALKSVNSTIKTTQSQLKDIEKLLKLDPSNTELLSQKQEKLKEAISATKEKLEALKTAQEQAKQQMENGELGRDKYREVYFRTTHTGKSVKYGWVMIVSAGISETLILRIFSMSGFVSSLRRASSSLFRIS